MNLKRYQSAKCKVDKTLVVIGIVNSIRKSSPLSGGFIKKCPKTGRWVSMSDEAAREKVGHCLRDMIASHRDDNSRQTIKPQKTNNAREPKPYVPNSGNEHIQMNLLANAAGLHGRFQNIPTTLPSLQKNNGNKKAGKQPAAKVKRQAKTRQPGALDATSRIRPPMETSSMPSRSGRDPPSFRPPFSFPGALPSPSFPALQQQMSNRISSSFNNFDAMAVARGCQEMSLQQQRILVLLENGFRGSVEELLEAVKY